MEQKQINVNENRNKQLFMDKETHEQINQHDFEQTSGTSIGDQHQQTLHGIYTKKVDEIVKQREIGEHVIESRQEYLSKHEDILDKNVTVSIHLQNENEKINMKRNVELQFSQKEFEKIVKIQSDTECLASKLNQWNTLIQCCVHDQHQSDGGQLQNEFNRLKVADEVKNQNYSRINQHFTDSTLHLQEGHIEKLRRYYAELADKEKKVQSGQARVLKLHYAQKDTVKTKSALANVNKKLSVERDTMRQNFTLIQAEYEEYRRNVDQAKNTALAEIDEAEQDEKKNKEIIETLVCENNNLQAIQHKQAERLKEITAKNRELEKSIASSNANSVAVKNQIETIKLQLQEHLAQYDEKMQSIGEEIKVNEEKYSTLGVEHEDLEQRIENTGKVHEELRAEDEKHNDELTHLQEKLIQSQVKLQDLITHSDETIGNLQRTIHEEQRKKDDTMKENESLRTELETVQSKFDQGEQEDKDLVQNAIEKQKDTNVRIAAMKDEVQRMQELATKEKESERAKLRKKLDAQLAAKRKECDNHVRKYEEHIQKHQQETENVIMNEATKKAKELNNLSNDLRNMDLQILENKTANESLREAMNEKTALAEQLRAKLAQLKMAKVKDEDSFEKLFRQDVLFSSQQNRQNQIADNPLFKTGYGNISISSISSQDDYPLKKPVSNAGKRAANKRSIVMVQTSTPKKPKPIQPKSDELLFDDPIIKENKSTQKTGPRKSLF